MHTMRLEIIILAVFTKPYFAYKFMITLLCAQVHVKDLFQTKNNKKKILRSLISRKILELLLFSSIESDVVSRTP